MKKMLIFTLFLFVTVFSANRLFAHVALDYPTGGETFTAGDTVTIKWHELIHHSLINWDLYYSEDGGNSWEPVAIDIDKGDLEYAWIVPSITTSEGKIRIVQDNSDTDYDAVSGNFTILDGNTAIDDNDLNSQHFAINGNYPNPFNPETTIRYTLPARSGSYNVKVEIYNALGQVVNILTNQLQQPGVHVLKWDGTNSEGREMPSGVYFALLQSGQYKSVQKMIMIK